MEWNYSSIPKLQRCNRWSLGMDKQFHPTLYNGCNYLSILGLQLIHVSKGPWSMDGVGSRRVKLHATSVSFAWCVVCDSALQWRHNGRDCVSNHLPHDCLLNRLSRLRSKKTSKLRVTGLCAGNSTGPVNSPHKWLASNAENISIWWRHHATYRSWQDGCIKGTVLLLTPRVLNKTVDICTEKN